MTSAAPSPRLEDFSAPYDFFAEKLYLMYRVSEAQLRAALPTPYAPRTVAGLHLAVLEVAHFFHVRGSGTSPPIPSYNEVIHWAPAVVGPRRTYCMWRLDLDDPLPIRLGRELYGFPKHLARIAYRQAPGSLEVEVEPDGGPRVSLVVRRRGWSRRVPLADTLVGRLAELFAEGELVFQHPSPGELTVSRVSGVQVEGAELGRVVSAQVPLFDELGLVRPDQATKPLAALVLPRFRITLGPPSSFALR